MGAADAIREDRLWQRHADMAKLGGTPKGGVNRQALSAEDAAARNLLGSWARARGFEVATDAIGNLFVRREGTDPKARPVMSGSHMDSQPTGGRFDGMYGVLAAFEALEALEDAGVTTRRPVVAVAWTNEEGSRFQPDMLGSLVHAGGLDLAAAHAATDSRGATVGAELRRIGYLGEDPPGFVTPHAFVELHIEQGPVLDTEGVTIGAVEDLQGISWQEVAVSGQSNHAGTTPMRLRRDAGYVAGVATAFLHDLAHDMGGAQVCTVGRIDLHPNLINVIPARASFTADLRNTDAVLLRHAEARFAAFLADIAARTGTTIATRSLARFEPVIFDARLVGLIETEARRMGLSVRRMTSGAGHDAQMMARICPAAMIFVPSIAGISHNPAERTEPADLVAGADLLLRTLAQLADEA